MHLSLKYAHLGPVSMNTLWKYERDVSSLMTLATTVFPNHTITSGLKIFKETGSSSRSVERKGSKFIEWSLFTCSYGHLRLQIGMLCARRTFLSKKKKKPGMQRRQLNFRGCMGDIRI